jgi:hypothetical protein
MEMMEGETTELRIKKGSGGEFGVKVSPGDVIQRGRRQPLYPEQLNNTTV